MYSLHLGKHTFVVGSAFPILQGVPLSVGTWKLQCPQTVWECACTGEKLQLSRWKIMSGIWSLAWGFPLLPLNKELTYFLKKGIHKVLFKGTGSARYLSAANFPRVAGMRPRVTKHYGTSLQKSKTKPCFEAELCMTTGQTVSLYGLNKRAQLQRKYWVQRRAAATEQQHIC